MQVQTMQLAANQHLLLADPAVVWVVQSGTAEVYAVDFEPGQTLGRRTHLFTAEIGQALFGIAAGADVGRGLMVTGGAATVLVRRNKDDLLALARKQDDVLFAEPALYLIESWVIALLAALSRQAPPNRFLLLDHGDSLVVPAGSAVRPTADIVWGRLTGSTSGFLAGQELPEGCGSQPVWPITRHTWLTVRDDVRLTGLSLIELLDFAADPAGNALWAVVDNFHRLAMAMLVRNAREDREAELARLDELQQHDGRTVQGAFFSLAVTSTGGQGSLESGGQNALTAACCQIAGKLGITPAEINARLAGKNGRFAARMQSWQALARVLKLGWRPVALQGSWWRDDAGPLLAFLRERRQPVALLPDSPGQYRLYDLDNQDYKLVDEQIAAVLAPDAVMFYATLPDRCISFWQLLKFVAAGLWRQDAVLLAVTAALGGLLGTLTPVITGILVGDVIPGGDKGELWPVAAFLAAGTISAFCLSFARAVAILRLEGRADSRLEAAIWERLLNMPPAFFRNFMVGDLANRANAVTAIRRLVSGAAASLVMAGSQLVCNAALLIYYDIKLAALVWGMGLTFTLVTLMLGYVQVRFRWKMMLLGNNVTSLLFQLLGSITKLRVAGAEARAYRLWAQGFAAMRGATFKVRVVGIVLAVVNAVFTVLVPILVFYAAAGGAAGQLPPGQFLAFYAAMGIFLTSLSTLATLSLSVLDSFPLLKMAQPLLATLPERNSSKADPGELRGGIELSRMSFRYRHDSQLALNDVSLTVKPGEFVAIVGPSGSGKSTLLRLLLGFQRPDTGTVCYDGKDLSELDLQLVRSQLGTVLQNGQLTVGSIFSNIVGSSGLTMKAAWEAAELAGIDQDIRQMPMGMHTLLGEGATTISGGQRQRLLIARAIVNKPRILLFDEATSAVDNATQAAISDGLARMKATRIVVAHRLSTIIPADRIYVLAGGRIVESGPYDELLDRGGHFAALVKRQLA